MARNKEIVDTIRDAWNGLSSDQKTIAGVLATIDTAGKAFALRDLARTNSRRIRGPKWLWTPIIGAVNTLGWVGYFVIGKKR
ncbi:phospholipase D-like protein [Corynebacterium afermentans]